MKSATRSNHPVVTIGEELSKESSSHKNRNELGTSRRKVASIMSTELDKPTMPKEGNSETDERVQVEEDLSEQEKSVPDDGSNGDGKELKAASLSRYDFEYLEKLRADIDLLIAATKNQTKGIDDLKAESETEEVLLANEEIRTKGLITQEQEEPESNNGSNDDLDAPGDSDDDKSLDNRTLYELDSPAKVAYLERKKKKKFENIAREKVKFEKKNEHRYRLTAFQDWSLKQQIKSFDEEKKKWKIAYETAIEKVDEPIPEDGYIDQNLPKKLYDTEDLSKQEILLLKLPPDIYSFIFVGGRTMVFALLVVLFQILFLIILIIGVRNDETEKICFPDTDVTSEVRVAQALSLIFYLTFPGSSVKDIIEGLNSFPAFHFESGRVQWYSEREDAFLREIRYLRLAFFMKWFLGCVAALTAFFLVMTSTSALDVVLNFAAVNFVSEIDNEVFALAEEGYFGMESVATFIKEYEVPEYVAFGTFISFMCQFVAKGCVDLEEGRYDSVPPLHQFDRSLLPKIVQVTLFLTFIIIATLFFTQQDTCPVVP